MGSLAKLFGWRRGIVYAYSVLDPITNERVHWAYVGRTRQSLVQRHSQHMGYTDKQDRQPWSDMYPSVRIVFDFKYCPDWWLDLVEKWTIKTMRPTYNYIHNTKNSRRVPKYVAEAQRADRERLRRIRRL